MLSLMDIQVCHESIDAVTVDSAWLDATDWTSFANLYWEEYRPKQLAVSFKAVADGGELHHDDLERAMEPFKLFINDDWIDEVYNGITQFSSLDCDEFVNFVGLYWTRMRQEFNTAFKMCDTDGSESIEVRELAGLLSAMGMEPLLPVIEEIFEEVDTDRSNSIELDEFHQFLRILKDREGFSLSEYERLMATFERFDLDQSQSLDTDEAFRSLRYMHYSITEEEARYLLEEVDPPDGRLDVQRYGDGKGSARTS
jgi:Ca2+-binding EF-hand superfamily protein